MTARLNMRELDLTLKKLPEEKLPPGTFKINDKTVRVSEKEITVFAPGARMTYRLETPERKTGQTARLSPDTFKIGDAMVKVTENAITVYRKEATIEYKFESRGSMVPKKER